MRVCCVEDIYGYEKKVEDKKLNYFEVFKHHLGLASSDANPNDWVPKWTPKRIDWSLFL